MPRASSGPNTSRSSQPSKRTTSTRTGREDVVMVSDGAAPAAGRTPSVRPNLPGIEPTCPAPRSTPPPRIQNVQKPKPNDENSTAVSSDLCAEGPRSEEGHDAE